MVPTFTATCANHFYSTTLPNLGQARHRRYPPVEEGYQSVYWHHEIKLTE